MKTYNLITYKCEKCGVLTKAYSHKLCKKCYHKKYTAKHKKYYSEKYFIQMKYFKSLNEEQIKKLAKDLLAQV